MLAKLLLLTAPQDRGGVTWAYSERYDWFGRYGTKEGWKPNAPADWVAATVAARKAVHGQPGWPPRLLKQ
jgi:hypothetical protein